MPFERMTRLEQKMDHVVSGVDLLVSRVDKLERRASLWGAIGGALMTLATHLTACFR